MQILSRTKLSKATIKRRIQRNQSVILLEGVIHRPVSRASLFGQHQVIRKTISQGNLSCGVVKTKGLMIDSSRKRCYSSIGLTWSQGWRKLSQTWRIPWAKTCRTTRTDLQNKSLLYKLIRKRHRSWIAQCFTRTRRIETFSTLCKTPLQKLDLSKKSTSRRLKTDLQQMRKKWMTWNS